jgi:hypothetical protein
MKRILKASILSFVLCFSAFVFAQSAAAQGGMRGHHGFYSHGSSYGHGNYFGHGNYYRHGSGCGVGSSCVMVTVVAIVLLVASNAQPILMIAALAVLIL